MIISAEIGLGIVALLSFAIGWVFGQDSGFQLGVVVGIDEYSRLLEETRKAEKE